MTFFFSSRRRHTRWPRDWSSDVCSSDLRDAPTKPAKRTRGNRIFQIIFSCMDSIFSKIGVGITLLTITFNISKRKLKPIQSKCLTKGIKEQKRSNLHKKEQSYSLKTSG